MMLLLLPTTQSLDLFFFQLLPMHEAQNYHLRNVEYSILLVMSELSPCGVIVRLVFGLQVHGRQVSTGSYRGGAVADGPRGRRR